MLRFVEIGGVQKKLGIGGDFMAIDTRNKIHLYFLHVAFPYAGVYRANSIFSIM
jgi:hypothetical protein